MNCFVGNQNGDGLSGSIELPLCLSPWKVYHPEVFFAGKVRGEKGIFCRVKELAATMVTFIEESDRFGPIDRGGNCP
ncbi:MAG TPA: hypothetical protein GX706_04360 [Candidatus Moranbacteria bacterium]|nr:hypothetical protein [Candidatus Moranbacteria bacterium]